nr:RHS repeat-associated core domain-containing protein [Fulvivirga marina]
MNVVLTEGNVVQKDDYYPFGLQFNSWNRVTTKPNKHLYNGKELQTDLGLNWYDYGLRFYDPVLGRWPVIDPLADEFHSWSSYNYTFNNPVRFTDPDGAAPTDIIVLSYGGSQRNHTFGHQAVLIGNDKDGYVFYSRDKDGSYTNSEGDVVNDNYTIKSFDSIEEFANSEYNTFKEDYDDDEGFKHSERDSDGNIKQRFKEGYRIKTDSETDEKMKAAADAKTKESFSLFSSNCTHGCKEALDAGGLNNGESTDGSKNYLPQTKQEEIERSNKGTDIDDQLVPKRDK